MQARQLRLFLCWLFLCTCLPRLLAASANTTVSPYSSRTWQTDDDPFKNAVQTIAQTSDGFLWVGTQNGLARFDGMQIEFFDFASAGGARGPRIATLCAGDNGVLWIGTTQGFYELRNGQIALRELPAGAVTNSILSLKRGPGGELWIGTAGGLALMKNEVISLVGNPTNAIGSPDRYVARDTVRSLTLGEKGEILAGVGDSLVILRDGVPATNFTFASFKPDFMRTVCRDREGTIWIGSNGGLIRMKDGQAQLFTKANGLPDNLITAIHEDYRGNLWIGTFTGLCRFANGKFVFEMSSDGEAFDQVFCFFEDRENNLWIGAKDGLHQLNVRQFTTYTMRHGLTHNNVVSVYEDKAGAMWIGTWGGGLHNLRDGKITVYSTAKAPAMINDLILGISGSRDGSIWFGEDYDGGLYRLHNGEVKHFGEQAGILRNAIRTLLEDRDGHLWLGRASGYLNCLRDGKLLTFGKPQGIPTPGIRCLLQTQDGRIWVGTEGGLCGYTNNGFENFTIEDGLSDNTIMSLHEDAEQNLWIGTMKGLNRMKEGRFTFYQSRDGLFEDAVLEVIEDDFGSLWMASHQGVCRVSKKDLDAFDAKKISKIPCINFGKSDGMRSQVCVAVAKPSAWKGQDGRLWFATTKGVAVADPSLVLSKNEKPPFVVVQKMSVDKRVQKQVQSPDNTGRGTTLNFPPGRGELEFEYTALSYTAPEKNRFKYKLEGFDSDWVDAGTRRVAYYNSIPPGDYTFHVTACNNDGVWNPLGSSIKLSLQPHFWQTIWFRALLIVASLSAAATGARVVTKRRMQRKLRRLEEQHTIERERSRIAQDIHDEIGAKLTRISFLGGLAKRKLAPEHEAEKHIDRMTGTARDLISALDEIVWAVNPKNDTLDNFADYLCRYASDFFENTPVLCQLEVPTVVPHHPVTADVRHNLFLAQKEALNNVLKHSGATKVQVQLLIREREFEVIIADNGRGFGETQNALSDAKRKRTGNGLGNMRERLEAIGGRYAIESSSGKGTKISFVVPLRMEKRG